MIRGSWILFLRKKCFLSEVIVQGVVFNAESPVFVFFR